MTLVTKYKFIPARGSGTDINATLKKHAGPRINYEEIAYLLSSIDGPNFIKAEWSQCVIAS